MAATASTSVRQLPRQANSSTAEPVAFRVLAWAVVGADLAIIGVGLLHQDGLDRDALQLLGWALMVAIVDLAPIAPSGGPRLDMDLPLLLAAALIYGPIPSGLLALLSSMDTRELRRDVSPARACYNRAQKSLSVMAAAGAFELANGRIGEWPMTALAAFVALVADIVTNYALVTLGGHLLLGGPFRSMLSCMKFGTSGLFVLTYACFGFLGVLLAEIYLRLGTWGLAAFVMPVALARQAFAGAHRLDVADEALQARKKALETISERIADERRDERLNVAAGLHDEVLPPLYKVHLMGQVLRQDLASGRLLALEDDVPELLSATERASEAMRVLIRELRRSSLGTRGLAETLRLLVRDFEQESSARIRLDLEEVQGSPLIQLLAYQVAREGIYNAVRHSGATEIRVGVFREGAHIRLIISDDGRGFDPSSVDEEAHFGLQLIRERVGLAGGLVQIESHPGEGTLVTARLPSDADNTT